MMNLLGYNSKQHVKIVRKNIFLKLKFRLPLRHAIRMLSPNSFHSRSFPVKFIRRHVSNYFDIIYNQIITIRPTNPYSPNVAISIPLLRSVGRRVFKKWGLKRMAVIFGISDSRKICSQYFATFPQTKPHLCRIYRQEPFPP